MPKILASQETSAPKGTRCNLEALHKQAASLCSASLLTNAPAQRRAIGMQRLAAFPVSVPRASPLRALANWTDTPAACRCPTPIPNVPPELGEDYLCSEALLAASRCDWS